MTTETDFAALTARYGTEPRFAALNNEVIETLVNHRSIRRYRPDGLPEGTLETLVAAAQSASTSSNLQSWSVVAIEDPARKEELAVLSGDQAQIKQAPLFLAWIVDLARLERAALSRGVQPDGLNYLEMFMVGTIDAALAAQNAAVAAESLGLGVVYIGSLRNYPERVAEILNLPDKALAVFGLVVGYADEQVNTAIKPRLPQQAVLHREQYDLAGQDAALQDYAATMSAFYRAQGMNVKGDWIDHSAQRVAAAASLGSRDRMREALAALGFELR